MAKMLSFIIIGLNEAKKLQNCFHSIYTAASYCSLAHFEIIYVDSDSEDNSIEIAKKYKEIRIFKLTGAFNPAIARNVGAKEALGDNLFFIDGDMEIDKSFLLYALDEKFKLKYELITGQIIHYYENGEGHISTNYTNKFKFLSCGIFLITKSLWDSVNGMKTKYDRAEDPDLGLRLIKRGHPVKFISQPITRHFTLPYQSKSRLWKLIKNKGMFYSRCVLYRSHIFNKYIYKYIYVNDKTFIIFVMMLLLCLFIPKYYPLFLLVYFTSILLRSVKQTKYVSTLEFMLYYASLDVLGFIYSFTFFPKMKKISYIKVTD